MTELLELPQLSGGRKRASTLVAAAHLPADLHGSTVIVDCRQLRAGTESFADELVHIILVQRGAARLHAENVAGDFVNYLTAAAVSYDVTDRLVVQAL